MREHAKDRQKLFDNWAARYDPHVTAHRPFPFAGYDTVLQTVVAQTTAQPTSRVLDLGTGTGNLAALLVGEEREIWGSDFSEEMIKRARVKYPAIRFVHQDLLASWPAGLPERFDRIVSAYVFHEFPLPTKLRILTDLAARHLSPGGRIVIGDIAFPSAALREQAHDRWRDLWDEDEAYWAFDETLEALKPVGLNAKYEQVSPCGGVFVFQQTSVDETSSQPNE